MLRLPRGLFHDFLADRLDNKQTPRDNLCICCVCMNRRTPLSGLAAPKFPSSAILISITPLVRLKLIRFHVSKRFPDCASLVVLDQVFSAWTPTSLTSTAMLDAISFGPNPGLERVLWLQCALETGAACHLHLSVLTCSLPPKT